jgi:predicted RecA/RadA family phage recombinase
LSYAGQPYQYNKNVSPPSEVDFDDALVDAFIRDCNNGLYNDSVIKQTAADSFANRQAQEQKKPFKSLSGNGGEVGLPYSGATKRKEAQAKRKVPQSTPTAKAAARPVLKKNQPEKSKDGVQEVLGVNYMSITADLSQIEESEEKYIRKYGFSTVNNAETEKIAKKRKILSIISNIAFFFCVAIIIGLTVLAVTSGDVAIKVFGLSYYSVTEGKSGNAKPAGAFVLSSKVSQAEIKIGDKITYLTSDRKAATNEIINIIDDYDESGYPAFGVDVESLDTNIVPFSRILGEEVFTVTGFGSFLLFISNNIWIMFIALVAVVFISYLIKMHLIANPKNKNKRKQKINKLRIP